MIYVVSIHISMEEFQQIRELIPNVVVNSIKPLYQQNVHNVPARVKSNRNRSIQNSFGNLLVSISDAPEYVKDNMNVLTGYRKEMSVVKALQTIFMWHNETLNIWSHLLASISFMTFMFLFIFNNASDKHKWPMIMYELGAICCFTISALFHCMLCVSKKHYEMWRKLDFCGIIIVMYSMFWPFCYYAFYDERNLFIIYISIASGLSGIFLCLFLLPIFQTRLFSITRISLFILLGACGVVPMIHVAFLKWHIDQIRLAFCLCVVQLSLHSIGAICYATQWPEIMKIFGTSQVYRRVDYFSSHFIFHVLIWFGLVAFHESNMVLYRL